MSEFQKILNWINTNTAGTSVIRNGSPVLGNRDFQIHYQTPTGHADPMRLFISPDIRLHLSASVKFAFHPPKRIGFSPFLYFYCHSSTMDLRCVDFTPYSDQQGFFRLMLIQRYEEAGKVDFTIKGLAPRADSSVFFIKDDTYLNPAHGWGIEPAGEDLRLKTEYDQLGRTCTVLQIGKKSALRAGVDLHTIFDLLKEEEQLCRNRFPGKYLIAGNVKKQSPDSIWFDQDVITPAGRIDPSIISEPNKNDFWFPWLAVLAEYLPHTEIKDQLRQCAYAYLNADKPMSPRFSYMAARLLDKNIDTAAVRDKNPFMAILKSLENDTFDSSGLEEINYFYVAYFGNGTDPGILANRLQQWWNRYSMPIYNLWWKRQLEQDPEKLLIIFLLALQLRIPWSETILIRCNKFISVPLFRVLVKLGKIFLIRHNHNGKLIIVPGPQRAGNISGTLARDRHLRIKVTQFGSEKYFSVFHNNRQMIKVDKDISCEVSRDGERYSFFPSIYPCRLTDFMINLLNIEDRMMMVRIPLVWRKGSIEVNALRVRWLLKKKRFQLTLQARSDIESYRVNDQKITLRKGERKVLYMYPEKIPVKCVLLIMSSEGASIHFRQRSIKRTIRIVGWLSDQYGVLFPELNYQYSNRQHLIKTDPTGQVARELVIPGGISRLSFLIKRHVEHVILNQFSNEAVEKFFRYDPVVNPERFIVRMGGKTTEEAKRIQDFFQNEFAFVPEIILDAGYDINTVTEGVFVKPDEGSFKKLPNVDQKILCINFPVGESIRRLIEQEISQLQG